MTTPPPIDAARIRAHLSVVLRDVAPLGLDLPMTIGPEVDPDDGSVGVRLGFPDGSRTLYGWEELTPGEELERIADAVHEWILEALPAHHRSTAWPPCPAHPGTHPLEVHRLGEAVTWACPVTGDPHTALGALAP